MRNSWHQPLNRSSNIRTAETIIALIVNFDGNNCSMCVVPVYKQRMTAILNAKKNCCKTRDYAFRIDLHIAKLPEMFGRRSAGWYWCVNKKRILMQEDYSKALRLLLCLIIQTLFTNSDSINITYIIKMILLSQ